MNPPTANQAWLLAGARSLTQASDVFQIAPDCEQFVHGLKLRPIEWRVLFSVDGYRSVREIGHMLGLDEQTGRDIFGKLAVLRVIETDEISLDQFLERRPPGLAGDPPPGLAIGPARRASALPHDSDEEKPAAPAAASITVVGPAEKPPASEPEPAPEPPPAASSEPAAETPIEKAPEPKVEEPVAEEPPAPDLAPEPVMPVVETPEPEPAAKAPEAPSPAPENIDAHPPEPAAPPAEEQAVPPPTEVAPVAEFTPATPSDEGGDAAVPPPAPAPAEVLPTAPPNEEAAVPPASEAPAAPLAIPQDDPTSAKPEPMPPSQPEPAEPVVERAEPRPVPVILPTTPVTLPPLHASAAPTPAPDTVTAFQPPLPPLSPLPARPSTPPRPLVRSIFDDLAATRGPHQELPRTTLVPANTPRPSKPSGPIVGGPVPAAPVLRGRPISPTAEPSVPSRAADAPFRFEPPAASSPPAEVGLTPLPSAPASTPERGPLPSLMSVRPVAPLPQRPAVSPLIAPLSVAIPPLFAPSPQAAPAPAPVPPPSPSPAEATAAPAAEIPTTRPFRLAAVIDFIMKQAGGGVIGQLAVYRVLLQVPPELLREAGIRSLEFDRVMEMEVRSPELQRALVAAVEKTLEVQVPPGQFTR